LACKQGEKPSTLYALLVWSGRYIHLGLGLTFGMSGTGIAADKRVQPFCIFWAKGAECTKVSGKYERMMEYGSVTGLRDAEAFI
jgi:hypothetical protein